MSSHIHGVQFIDDSLEYDTMGSFWCWHLNQIYSIFVTQLSSVGKLVLYADACTYLFLTDDPVSAINSYWLLPPIIISGHAIEFVSHFKILGVECDPKLTWRSDLSLRPKRGNSHFYANNPWPDSTHKSIFFQGPVTLNLLSEDALAIESLARFKPFLKAPLIHINIQFLWGFLAVSVGPSLINCKCIICNYT